MTSFLNVLRPKATRWYPLLLMHWKKSPYFSRRHNVPCELRESASAVRKGLTEEQIFIHRNYHELSQFVTRLRSDEKLTLMCNNYRWLLIVVWNSTLVLLLDRKTLNELTGSKHFQKSTAKVLIIRTIDINNYLRYITLWVMKTSWEIST